MKRFRMSVAMLALLTVVALAGCTGEREQLRHALAVEADRDLLLADVASGNLPDHVTALARDYLEQENRRGHRSG